MSRNPISIAACHYSLYDKQLSKINLITELKFLKMANNRELAEIRQHITGTIRMLINIVGRQQEFYWKNNIEYDYDW